MRERAFPKYEAQAAGRPRRIYLLRHGYPHDVVDPKDTLRATAPKADAAPPAP